MRRIALAVALAAALAACTGGDPSGSPVGTIDDIVVTGEADGSPGLEFPLGLEYKGVQTRVEWEGEGDALEPGGPLLLDIYAVSLADGRVLRDTHDGLDGQPGLPQYTLFAPELIGKDLYDVLVGKRAGTRLLHVSPPVEGYENQGPVALVVDVVPTRASGRAQPARDSLPVVVLGEDGAPAITVREDEPAPIDLTAYTLVQGQGEQVRVGSWVLVNYVAVYHDSGQVYQTSWQPEVGPYRTQIGVGANIEGWEKGLLDRYEGSQVLLVVPATQAWGEDAVVFVVDILAVWSPS